MSRLLSVSFAASGTTSWVADRDCVVTQAYFSGNGSFVVSTNPADTSTVVSAPTAGKRFDLIAIGSTNFRPAGQWILAFPVSAGEVIYFAVSVLGIIQLILEDALS